MSDALIKAISVLLPETSGDALPTDFQWMPPGRHSISASKNGKPARIEVLVDASGATAVAKSFDELKASGRRPYLDFNHESREASAIVQSVYWGGDDPKTGGIRCKVEWTQPGAAALKGKAYFSFSPTFFVSKEGKITGTETDMGGLVNEPAFTNIAPIVGKENSNEMNELLKALKNAGITASETVTESEAVSAVQAHASSQKTKIEALERDLSTAKTKIEAAEKKRAEDLVLTAVKEGKIGPKDEKVQAFYVKAILTQGKDGEDALEALPVQAKFKSVVPPQGAPKTEESGSSDDPEKAFLAKAREIKADPARKIETETDAQLVCASENPKLYDGYLKAICNKSETGE
jgi:phage I-like protein